MAMSREHFRLAAKALGNEPGLELVYKLKDQGKGTASSLASATGLHTATAMKYLGALADAGLLETRTVRGKTREMIEYRLPRPCIVLALDLSEELKDEEIRAAGVLVKALVEKVEKVYGELLDPLSFGSPCDLFFSLEETYGRERAIDLVNGALRTLEKRGEDRSSFVRLLPILSSAEVEA